MGVQDFPGPGVEQQSIYNSHESGHHNQLDAMVFQNIDNAPGELGPVEICLEAGPFNELDGYICIGRHFHSPTGAIDDHQLYR